MTRFALVFYAVLALGSLAWAGLLDHRWVWQMPGGTTLGRPMAPFLPGWVRGVVWAMAGFLFGASVAGLGRLASGKVAWVDAMEEGFSDLVGPIGPVQAFAMAAASAVGEEFLFRGIVLPATGLFWSSLLFGLVHLPMDRRFLVWPLFAALAGLALGALTLGSGNLWPAVLGHFTVNFLNLVTIGRKAATRLPLTGGRGLDSEAVGGSEGRADWDRIRGSGGGMQVDGGCDVEGEAEADVQGDVDGGE